MFDQKDISNLGEEFERGLRAYGDAFNERQVKAARTAFEMATMNAFVLLEGRFQPKGAQIPPFRKPQAK